jgi:hypothetical protein
VKLVIVALGVLINFTGFTPIRGPRRPSSLTADLVAVTRQRLTTSYATFELNTCNVA